MRRVVVIVVALIGAATSSAKDRIAYIEFFGYQGIDVEAVRKELPFHDGDPTAPAMATVARAVVKRVTGKDATDVAFVCCINDGDTVMFIGLGGTSSRPFAMNPRPAQNLSLSQELLKLANDMEEAENAATDPVEVDNPPGYRLLKDPKARAAELKVREYARAHVQEIIRVLSRAVDQDQRATAAEALGFADRSAAQLDALVAASRDPDGTVRNAAIRALMEILRGDPSAASQVPAAPFIEMLHSGTWTDRNKSTGVLAALSATRDVGLLANIKARAWEALLEMSRWRPFAWSAEPRIILARIAGIPEERAIGLAFAGVAPFLEAIGAK
jgi:hypothetical protein